ncbi:MAG TPA: tetratricopeptide repeat protein [Anaeromyxobacter sp.]|nr:tetratricopeptide repeat protein [Anaeromyxobacter sp.]
MPSATCIRCFAVFASEEVRPGAAPVCPSCTAALSFGPVIASPGARPRATRRVGPLVRRAALLVAALAAAAGLLGAAVAGFRIVRARLRRPAPALLPAAPSAAEEALAAWRAGGVLPPRGAAPAGQAAARLAEGELALAKGMPARTEEAMRAFREALAQDPQSSEAVAGYAVALADRGLEALEGDELARAHALVREALSRRPGDPHLMAAYARLLEGVPSARNLAEAAQVAARAVAAAPADPDAVLAAGLVEMRREPASAATRLAQAAARLPGDRRLLSAAARAAWAAGDAARAMALSRARLSLDPDQPGALALTAEVALAVDRPDEARAALERWAESDRHAAEPLLLEARLRHQLDRDQNAARRLLEAAMERAPDDFLAARILAHRAAVEREAGDLPAAQAAVAEALRRVPASAAAQYQAALLAYAARDARALREAAGTVGERAGPRAEMELAVRLAELSGHPEDAEQAYRAVADKVARDPEALLSVAGGLAKSGASRAALQAVEQALRRDLADARLGRPPGDFWTGPEPLADSAQVLEELARVLPSSAGPALSGAAACELILGHARNAEALARSAAAALPQAGVADAIRAQAALDLGQPARALPLASGAAAEGGAAAEATLGRALEASGRMEEAERAYRNALSSVPDLLAVRLSLSRILARRGQAQAGRELLSGLLKDGPDLPAVRRALLDLGSAGGAP